MFLGLLRRHMSRFRDLRGAKEARLGVIAPWLFAPVFWTEWRWQREAWQVQEHET